jgi:D-amino-acid dehydrogenase
LDGAATAAGAGIVCSWSVPADSPHAAVRAKAVDHYPKLMAQLAADGVHNSSFDMVGALVVSEDERELDDIYSCATRQASSTRPGSRDVRRLRPGAAQSFVPVLSSRLGAVFCGWAGRVDGAELRASLLRAARGRGAELIAGRARLVGDDVVIGDSPMRADRVIVAAGAWSDLVLAPADVAARVTPQRGQVVHLRVDGCGDWPVVLSASGNYLVPFPGSRLVAGTTREAGSGFQHQVTASGREWVLDKARHLAPGLTDVVVLETRAGLRPMSHDGLPVLGPAPERPDLLLATGFGSAGLTLGPLAGDVVATVAMGEEPLIIVGGPR